VSSTDFATPLYKRIYETAARAHNAGVPVEARAIKTLLERDGLSQQQEREYLSLVSASTDISAEDAARSIVERARKVRLAHRLRDAVSALQNGASADDTAREIRDYLGKDVDRTIRVMSMQDAFQEALDYYSAETISTGFPCLDHQIVGGLRPGLVYGIAARPKVGKSMLGGIIVANVAAQGHRSAYISLEMSGASLFMRVLSRQAQFPHEMLQHRFTDSANKIAVAEAIDRVCDIPMSLATPPANLDDIMRSIRHLAATGHRVIAVDYLQLIYAGGSYRGGRAQELGLITGQLKNVARRLGVSLIEIVQLKRPYREREGQRQYFSDARDSGTIEQDVDVGMVLEQVSRQSMRLHIDMQRSGPDGGHVDFEFRPQFTDIREVAQ
jgi:replicative DNA helicase